MTGLPLEAADQAAEPGRHRADRQSWNGASLMAMSNAP
jgi:hypothetical protein